jgi:hypothetical protein
LNVALEPDFEKFPRDPRLKKTGIYNKQKDNFSIFVSI